MNKKFLDPQEFAKEIAETAEKSGEGLLDALMDWCERRGLESEALVPLILKDQEFMELLRVEARGLRLLKD